MKFQFFLGLLLAAVLFAAPAFAQSAGSSDGSGTGEGDKLVVPVSIEEAKKLSENAPVILEGVITKNAGGTRYEFKDDSGTGNIRIDKNTWRDANVKFNEKVKVVGIGAESLEKEKSKVYVEVHGIEKLVE